MLRNLHMESLGRGKQTDFGRFWKNDPNKIQLGRQQDLQVMVGLLPLSQVQMNVDRPIENFLNPFNPLCDIIQQLGKNGIRTGALVATLQIEVNPSKNVIHLMYQPRGQLGIQLIGCPLEDEIGIWIFIIQ